MKKLRIALRRHFGHRCSGSTGAPQRRHAGFWATIPFTRLSLGARVRFVACGRTSFRARYCAGYVAGERRGSEARV
jgi:hypothetical protein